MTNNKFNPAAYEPKSVADIVFADDDKRVFLDDLISGNHPFPLSGKNGILLYGVPGTGKSALARLLPDAMEAVRSGGNACERFEGIQPGNNGAVLMAKLEQQAILVPFASHHYFVLDEIDNLNAAAMLSLKSVMNIHQSIFIMTTNYFEKIEAGVRNRCHCIPFNAAPAIKWLPLARRMFADAEINGVKDSSLTQNIELCNGSARDIVSAITRIILDVRRLREKSASYTAVYNDSFLNQQTNKGIEMSDLKDYDEYACIKIQLKYELSDDICKEIENELYIVLSDVFDECIMVTVFTDDHLLFVRCGMFSFEFATENANAISKLARSETEKCISNIVKAATATVLAVCNSPPSTVV